MNEWGMRMQPIRMIQGSRGKGRGRETELHTPLSTLPARKVVGRLSPWLLQCV